MKFLKFLYYLLFIYSIGLYSVPTSAEIACNLIFNPTTQISIAEISSSSKVNLFFSSYNTSHFRKVSEIKTFSEKGIIPEFTELNFYSSEKKWLGLLYLDEDGKIATHPNGAILSQEHQKFFGRPELVEAWSVFKNKGLDDLARSTDDLEIISDYMKRSGKSADDVASEIPSNVSDAKKWLGDRQIEPFLDGNPNISNAFAPDGYQIYEVNGSKYIRRLDGDNPYTPRLMVDENGVIVTYTKPARMSVSAKFSKNLEDIYGALPTNHQRHHLVPDNVVRNSPLHQEAAKRGLYDLDRGGNGRYLAETAEDYVYDASNHSKNYPTHLGSHPNYDDAINSAIDDIFINNGINKNAISELDDATIKNLVDEIEDAALDVLEDWQPSRLN